MSSTVCMDQYSFLGNKRRPGNFARRSIIFLLPVLFSLIMAGCSSLRVSEPPQGIFLSPEERWQRLKGEEPLPKAFKALARINLRTPSSRTPPFNVAILLQAPDRFRLESLPLFGPPNLYLTVLNSEMKVFLPEQGKFFIGTGSQKQLASFLPLISSRVQLSDLFALFRGKVPLPEERDIALKGFQEGDYYRLEVYSGQRKVRDLWLEPESNTLARAALWGKNNDLLYTAEFEEYGRIRSAANFPAKISVKTEPPDSSTLTLSYTDLQLLQEIPPEAFSLEVPPGVEPVWLNKE